MGRKQQQKLPAPEENIYPHDGSPEIGSVTNQQGLKLMTYVWRVKEPKAAVLFIHGVQTHARFEFLRHLQPEDPELPIPAAGSVTGDAEPGANTPSTAQAAGDATSKKDSPAKGSKQYTRWCIYEGSWVQQLNDAGCSVYAGDLQSFGLSEGWKGRRCSVERLDHLASDVVCFAEYAANDLMKQLGDAQPPPIFFVGISMGGFSVVRSLEVMGKENHYLVRAEGTAPEDKRPRIVGCVALAPMLSVEKASAGALNKAAAKVGGVLSRLTPHLGIAKVPPARLLWVDVQKDEDPLVTCPSKIPCRMAVEVLSAVPRVHAEAKHIPSHLRLLIIHAKEDTIVEPVGSSRFHKESAAHVTERHLQLLEGDRGHYLVIEPENAEVINSIREFLKIQ